MGPIFIRNTQKFIKINTKETQRTVQAMLNAAHYPTWSLTIWFCNNKFIRTFNLKYRGINKATDILTFPMVVYFFIYLESN